MGTRRFSWFNVQLLVALLVLFLAAVAEAATVSGTVTNNSGISGRVYVGLKTTWGDIEREVSVQTTGSTPKAFTIKGVNDGNYTIIAYVDRTGTGWAHANDPSVSGTTGGVVVTGGSNVSGINLTIAAPGSTVVPTTALAAPDILPAPGGVMFIREGEQDASGAIMVDAYNLNCNSGAIVRNNIPNPTQPGDNFSLVVIPGLTDGATVSCTVTPVIKGVAYPTLTSPASAPVTVGNTCTVFDTCNSGVTVSGRVKFSGFASLTGKTLLTILSDWNGNNVYATATQNPATVQSYSIPGVAASSAAWRTEFFLIDTNPGYFGVGSNSVNERMESARLIVDGGMDVVAPDVTISNRNASASVNALRGFDSFGNNWNALDFNVFGEQKQPVNITLTNNSGAGLPAEGVSASQKRSSYINANTGFDPGNTYNALFEYSDGTTETIPLEVIKGAVDARIKQSFPAGKVRIPDLNNPITAWNYSTFAPPLPGTVTTAIQATNFNWMENLTTAVNWFQHNSSTPLTVGSFYNVQTEFEDMLGDKTSVRSDFTPVANGPLITGLSPATGGSNTAVTITGSGFTGATAVAFNGFTTPFTVVSDTQITTTVPSGAARGPVTVTTADITGVSTIPFEKTVTTSGKVTNGAGTALSGITVQTIGAGTTLSTTTNATGDFILTVPAGIPIYFKFTDPAGTYRDVYSRFAAYSNTVTNNDYTLYSTTDLSAWEAKDASFTAIKNSTAGMIRARVSRNDAARTPVAGVTLSVRSRFYPNGNPNYKLIYADASGLPDTTLTSTSSGARFFVTGIEQGDTVVVFADMAGYGFIDNVYQVFNGSIGAGRIHGEPMPNVTLSPSGGNIMFGSPVTVTLDQTGTLLYTTDNKDPKYFGTAVGNGGVINLPVGNVTLKYTTRNNSGVFGNIGTASYNVIQDTTPPTVTTNPGYLNQSGNNYTYTNTLPLNVTFSANEPVTIYYTTNGATPTTSSTSVAFSNGTSAPIAISQNLTTLKFFGVDSFGNSSNIETVRYVLDNTPPTISNVAVNALNNSKTVAMSVSADDVSGLAGFLAEATNTAPLPTDPAWQGSSFLYVTVAADGDYTYYVWVKDNAGNVSTTAYAASFTVDSTPPAAPSIDAPANGASLNTQTPTISGTAEAGSTINVYEGASWRASGIANGGAFVLTTNTMPAGAHFLTITAQDAAGNTSPATELSLIIDLTKPAVPVITAPASGAYLSTATPTITGTAEAYSIITIRDATTVVGTGTCAANGSFSIVTNQLLDGSYTLTVTATDGAGNESDAASRSFMVDTTPPTTTILSNPANPTNQLSATFTFEGIDATSGLKSFECKLNTQAAFGACTSPVTYPGLTGNPATSYTFQVRAIDNANNVDATPASYSWTVNTTGPNVTATPAGGSFATFPQTVSISSDVAATVYYTLDGTAPTTASPSLTFATAGSQNISIPAAGTNLRFFGRDAALNSSATLSYFYLQAQTITVNTPAPATAAYGSSFTVNATASSSLLVAYTSGSPTICSNVGATFTMLAPSGTCIVQYNQSGNATFGAANQVTSNTTATKATPTASITNTPVVYNGALQTATVACLGGGTATLASGGSGTNAGSYPATVDCAASTNYSAATGLTPTNGPFVITKASPTASITNTPVVYNGTLQTATVACLGNGTATLASGGTGTNAGSYPATVDCATSTNYNAATGLTPTNGAFVIDKATPTLSVTNSPVTYDGSAKTATVSASVAGVVSNIQIGGAVNQTGAGTYAVTASFAPTDTTNYNALTSATAGNFIITKATPTASITNTPVVYNGALQTATVACLGGGTATLASGGSGTNAGSYPATVDCAASTNYNAAAGLTPTNGAFVIDKATPTASITNTPVVYNGALQTATVACLGGGTATLASGGTGTNAGSYPATVDCAASTNYNAAAGLTPTNGAFVIDKATPTLSVTNSPVTYDGSSKAATVTCSSGGAASNIVTGNAAGQIHAGTYTVTADCAATTNYLPLTAAAAGNFIINKAIPVLTVTNSPVIYDGTAKTATVSASAPGTVSSILTGGSATQTAIGTYPVTASFVPTDSANYTTLTNAAAGNFVIVAPTQTATVSNSPVTYNGSPQAATVTCSGGTAGNIRYNNSATVPTNAGSYAILVDCAAGGFYNATSDVAAGDFVINKATPTLAVTNSPVTYDGTAKAATVTCSSGGATSNILTGGAASQTNAGTYAVTADCAATTNFQALTAAAAGNFVINKATPTITWANPADIPYGTLLGSTQLNAATAAPGTFSYDQPAGTKLQPGVHTLSTTFPSSTNYTSATASVQVRVLNPTGDVNGDGRLDLVDALMMLRMSTGVSAAQLGLSAGYLDRGDVGPFNGSSVPDGVINSGDAIVMLRKIVGLINWI